jgi:hypothetical protein
VTGATPIAARARGRYEEEVPPATQQLIDFKKALVLGVKCHKWGGNGKKKPKTILLVGPGDSVLQYS